MSLTPIQDMIQVKLQQQFEPNFLEVINESHQHNVPEGSESHFKVVIVSQQFIGQRFYYLQISNCL